MAVNNTNYITAGTPKVAGAVFHAPIGTKLPTDSTTALDAGFVNLGYISEDGVKKSESITVEETKDWGGNIVYQNQSEKKATYSLSFLEFLNPEVQKLIHGSDNVEGDIDTGMTVRGNSGELDEEVIVIEQIMHNNVLMRTVIPRAKITSIDEITFAKGSVAGVGVEFSAMEYSAWGDYYREYSIKSTGE